MMTNEEMEVALAASPSDDRVTEGRIKDRIERAEYFRIGETVTVCSLTLNNGYSVRGESACVDPANYNQALGEKIAFDDAFRKLWPLFGFLLAERRYTRKLAEPLA